MSDKKESALRCVLTLTVIAVVCGVLLAVLNPLLYVAPSAEDISNNFSVEGVESGEWTLLDIDETFAGKTSDKSGAAVSLAAAMESNGETYYGLLITTKASGNLSECKFVMFFRKSDNKLIDCKMTVDGSSGGKYSFDNVTEAKPFKDYYVVIESEEQFTGSYDIPKVGATLTLTAVDNAFKKAAYYYYNMFVKGGKA